MLFFDWLLRRGVSLHLLGGRNRKTGGLQGARPDASLGTQNYWETLQLTANLTRPRRVPETKPGTWRKAP